LGVAFPNSALRRAGHDTPWADILAGGESIETILTRYQPDVVGISVHNIDDVIIRKRETLFDNLLFLVETVRHNIKCPVVVGASGFSISPRHCWNCPAQIMASEAKARRGLFPCWPLTTAAATFLTSPVWFAVKTGILSSTRPPEARAGKCWRTVIGL